MKENKKEQDDKLHVPIKMDGTNFSLDEAKQEQRIILYHVFNTLKQWIDKNPNYKPLHRIVSGGGGTGKSYLIHQITTVVRTMFGKNDAVETAAYTGSAAYNIRGKTIHSAYSINCTNPDTEMSQTNRDKLMRRLRHTVALLFDERSMIPADVLGAAERNIALTCHGGNKFKKFWGGIPIVLFFGDDYQLPPVQINGKGKGAFNVLDYTASRYKKVSSTEVRGIQEFMRLSKGAFVLHRSQRIQHDQNEFKALLDRVRIGEPTEEDKATILSLGFHRLPKTTREEYERSIETLHLFATRDMCSQHNFNKMKEHNSEDNPVAFLKHKLPRHMINNQNDNNAIPQVTCFSRGCKVSIKGRNFCPTLGLYNGAIGTVREIVFKKGESPNSGNLPLYVAVDFPNYIGHHKNFGEYIWDKDHPTVIPIPMVTTIDTKSNKAITFCPLVLSFARTIHTFQGQSAGPTKDNNKNQIQRIICDVGTARFESQNIGLFYTALSRATTIGTVQNNRYDSAIFFTQSTDKTRLDRLTKKTDNTEYEMIKKRKAWIQHVEKHLDTDNKTITDKQIDEIFKWATTQKYTLEELNEVTQ